MNEKVKVVAQVLADLINNDIPLRGMNRKLLDSIAGLKIDPEISLTKRSCYVKWLNKADLRKKSYRGYVNLIDQSPTVRDIYNTNGDGALPKGCNLICDHVVPIAEITNMLYAEKGCLTAAHVMKLHDKYYHRCILTDLQNSKLDKAGYKSKMPEDWDGKDIYARYRKVKFTWVEDF